MKTMRNNNEGSLFQVKNGAKAGFWVAKVCLGYNGERQTHYQAGAKKRKD